MNVMIRCAIGLALVCAGGAVGYFAGAQDKSKAPERTLKENEIARVGERVISAEEFIERLTERERMYQDPDLRTATWALDSLLVEEMLALECDRLGAVPKQREVQAEYDAAMKSWEETEFKTINDLLLKWQKENGLEVRGYTREEFLKVRYEMSVAEFEAYMRQQAMLRIKLRLVVNYWMVSTDHADAEGLRMRNLTDIEKIRERLIRGEKLSLIAAEFSEDMHTRSNGGEIGTVYRKDGTFGPEVEAVFWELKEKEWSSPISTGTGYWIVRKAAIYAGNEAEFFNLREELIGNPDPKPQQVIRWRHAMASSGLVHFERRMPGWDVQAGQK